MLLKAELLQSLTIFLAALQARDEGRAQVHVHRMIRGTKAWTGKMRTIATSDFHVLRAYVDEENSASKMANRPPQSCRNEGGLSDLPR